MNRMCSMALPALSALGGLVLWGSSATAQYLGGRPPDAPVYYYTPGYYYAPGSGYYGSGYSYAPRPTAGPYYYAAPRPVPSHSFGLEPESLPAQIAEDIASGPASRLGPTRPTSWWRGRTWRRTWRSW